MLVTDQIAVKILDGVRPRDREVLGLHYFDGFSPADIATMLGITVGAVDGYLSKGRTATARVLGINDQRTKDLYEGLGETIRQNLPEREITLGGDADNGGVVVRICPYRGVTGGVVRGDHEASDITAFYIDTINGRKVTAPEAREWFLESPIRFGHSLRREVLAMKGIKSRASFDEASHGYWFGAGMGLHELYYERDYEHSRLLVASGTNMMDVMSHEPPPLELTRSLRPKLLPKKWKPQVFDDGGDAKSCAEKLAVDIEAVVRRQRD